MSEQKQEFGASAIADRGSREPSQASCLGPGGLRSPSVEERVAEALHDAELGQRFAGAWGKQPGVMRERYRHMAKAAIAAIGEQP